MLRIRHIRVLYHNGSDPHRHDHYSNECARVVVRDPREGKERVIQNNIHLLLYQSSATLLRTQVVHSFRNIATNHPQSLTPSSRDRQESLARMGNSSRSFTDWLTDHNMKFRFSLFHHKDTADTDCLTSTECISNWCSYWLGKIQRSNSLFDMNANNLYKLTIK
jgi:hypothetical protein